MFRERLPNRRKCVTRMVRINGQTVYMNVGLYADGRPGEIFIDVAKAGSALRAWAGTTAKLMSLMLQYGVPLCEVVDALSGTNSVPFSAVPVEGHEGISECTGEMDYLAQALVNDFAEHTSEVDCDLWDVLADAMDRLFDGECDAEQVRSELTARGADEALDTLLEAFVDEH